MNTVTFLRRQDQLLRNLKSEDSSSWGLGSNPEELVLEHPLNYSQLRETPYLEMFIAFLDKYRGSCFREVGGGSGPPFPSIPPLGTSLLEVLM